MENIAIDRVCGWCGISIAHKKANAKYCSIQHKKNASGVRFRERNPGYYKQYHGSPARESWKAENIERIRAYAREHQRQYRLDHPDAAKTWWANNLDKHRLYESKRRAGKLNNPGSVGVSDRDWKRLVHRYAGCCAYCGTKPDTLHLEHVIPLSRGGRHAIGNILPACAPCNLSKNARLLTEWRLRAVRHAPGETHAHKHDG